MQASRTHLTPGHVLHLCRTQKIALHSPKTEESFTFPLLWNRQAITAPQILLITQFTGVLLSHRLLCSHSAQENGGKQGFLSQLWFAGAVQEDTLHVHFVVLLTHVPSSSEQEVVCEQLFNRTAAEQKQIMLGSTLKTNLMVEKGKAPACSLPNSLRQFAAFFMNEVITKAVVRISHNQDGAWLFSPINVLSTPPQSPIMDFH